MEKYMENMKEYCRNMWENEEISGKYEDICEKYVENQWE